MSAIGKGANGNTSPAAGGAPAAAAAAAAGGAATGITSLLKFEHIVRKTSPGYSLDTRVLDQLDSYTEYVRQLTGHAPAKDEVVEKALQHIFAADTGFKKFLTSGSVGRSSASVKKNPTGPAVTASAEGEPAATGKVSAQNA